MTISRDSLTMRPNSHAGALPPCSGSDAKPVCRGIARLYRMAPRRSKRRLRAGTEGTEETGSTRRNGATENKTEKNNQLSVSSRLLGCSALNPLSLTRSVPVEAPLPDRNRGDGGNGINTEKRSNGEQNGEEQSTFRFVPVTRLLRVESVISDPLRAGRSAGCGREPRGRRKRDQHGETEQRRTKWRRTINFPFRPGYSVAPR